MYPFRCFSLWDENSSLGVSIPYTNLGQVSAHPNEAMNIHAQLLVAHARG
jgi:hypothetical protein